MKTLIVLALLSSACGEILANAPEAPADVDVDKYVRSYKRVQARRNAGVALTVAGVTSAVLGAVLIGYAVVEEQNLNAEVAELVAGSANELVGLVLGVPGLILWMSGQDRMDSLRWRREKLLRPYAAASPHGGTAGLQLNF